MVARGFLVREGLLLACFLFLSVYGQTSGPYFMVTFPAVIESGSEATLCTSLLKPNETLQMTIYLVHDSQNRIILQERVEEEFHLCSQFKAPQVESQSVQEIRVEVKGESFQMTEKRKVMFKSYNPLTFIQTDKPIYNPGQTVNFRVVTVNANFVPLKQEYSVLTLEDNKGNRIGQWTNVSSTGLIVQLSHKLNPEAPEGQYKVKANIGDRSITHNFKVKKYVLPRFEITVKTPEEQSVGEEELKIEVCAKYTYGQPVPGKALVQVCRKFRHFIVWGFATISPCLIETVEMKENGCASPVFNMSHFISSKFEHLKDSLDAIVTVTEEGTDISMEKSQSIKITYEIGKAEFLDLPKNFKRDKLLKGKIKVSTFNGKPIPNKNVYLLEGHRWSPTLLQNLTTDVNGLASFSFNTSDHSKTQISLLASVYPDNQYRGHKKPFFTVSNANIPLLQPATPYSPVYSELSIESLEEPIPCGSEISINIKYYIVGEPTENYSTDIIYTVLSKGAIVHHGYEKVEVKESKKLIEGKVSFRLSVDADLAPVVQVLVYCVLPSENVIAASKNFNVEKCFRHKVSLQFSPTEAVPGEENTLQLSALPGSLCGLSAVDQSVFIMEPGKRLSVSEVFNLLPVKSVSGYNYEVEDDQECLHVRPRRDAQIDHAYNTIKGVGLKMATNLAVRIPECLFYRRLQYHRRYHHIGVPRQGRFRFSHVAFARVMDSPRESESIETVRKFFPETWIWQLAEVGDSGSAQVPVTVPDTITTWETEAFCLSSRGLGLAPPAQLRVFQPFFLELSLPYSIIRGEEFELKATVFNYISKCIMVKVTPAPSSHYTLKASSDGEYSSCLCANGRKTFKWTLVPSVLGVLNVTVSAEAEQSQTVCDNEIVSVPERGRIDTVTRSLLVQAEGTEKTKSHSWLLCPQGNSVSEEVELVLPEDVIEGSARASVSVLGDILGRALKNIDGLLKMPYGCGEQNIAILSPNIYILQYLENTGQLTAAIRERATGFLKSGYQRQLNYKHCDGAYSTFGRGEGNTWLTAFVLRTFGKAQHYIFIDPQKIDSAKKWLISKQRPDGCFIRQGRLFNNRMKGGVNDDVTMTAYITASLLELGHTIEDPDVSKGLLCLKSSIGNLTNTYGTALLAYTFSLAGENDARVQLLKKLDSIAISGDGGLHWSQSASDDSDSLAVEISSYVLLAVLTAAEITAADLGYANRIVSWLVRQQNPYGGFSSTQDTVVALQALALYSTKVFSSDGSSTVTVQSADKESHHFDVNQNNKLLYQERPLQDIPGKYSISVEGSTCVSVQVALFYNIPTPTETNTLSIEAKTDGNCTKSFGYTLSINFTVTYSGELSSTNMVIVDIKILSGFTADPSDLKYRPLVERVDSKDDHVIMYVKEVPRNSPMNYQLHLKQLLPVKNLKPAVIKVYDYYQTSDQSETEYSFPCV
ncbi:alpha-2-macroglobulin-like isoform X2 [Colossoma macropomum]|uniref:alpha-2-macroglobulin-like isoform X2 n=1 Tax=Colossoma macropomum TaxID=42526 RepID=UPI0018645288|nr:alpha-2-macroglobulin-like isoform X2 [Colossoma macropomum]